VALAALLGSVVLATPAAAQEESPANISREGPNLTLIVANCQRAADIAIAQDLARYGRNAAAACLDPDGVPAETAAIISEFAPDQVLVVGGHDVIPASVMATVRAQVRAAYRWTVVHDLGGATRVETAAAAARRRLGLPEHAGANSVTFIVANGWNAADVNTALEFAGTVDDAALVYFNPDEVSNGLSEATVSLISDYRPVRVVFAGLADDAGMAAEAAVEALLEALESDVHVERVAVATGAPSPAADIATLTRAARETFEDIVNGRHTPHSVDPGEPLPYLALTQASGIRGVGSTLFTVRADGRDRKLRTVDHNGWEWNHSDGRLGWADDEERMMVASADADGEVLVDASTWPWWSPDGRHLLTWNNEDTNDNDRLDSFEAVLRRANGQTLRSLGQMDARTWYYGDIRDQIWSRDGAYLAYVTGHTDPETGEEVNEARIEPTDGSVPPVTLAEDAIILRWSSDSKHLLYATPHECAADPTVESWNLWLASADGSETREIGSIRYRAWTVVITNLWSPDGKHFAYEALDPVDCSTELRVASAGSDAEPVSIAEDAKFLGWSPDSTYLEYGEETDRLVTDYILPELSWIAHRDGSSTRFIGELSPSAFGWILWSDDGSHIAYTSLLRDADGNPTGLSAHVERTDGVVESTTLAQAGNALSWSDDGRLAYVAGHDDDGDGLPDREALYLHSTVPLEPDVELVHALPAPTRVGIWSPDSSQLIYASGSIDSLIGWFRDRGRGVNVWGVATSDPRWTYRLITDVTWGEWQPDPEAE
jgi:hypothetical protein